LLETFECNGEANLANSAQANAAGDPEGVIIVVGDTVAFSPNICDWRCRRHARDRRPERRSAPARNSPPGEALMTFRLRLESPRFADTFM
jgi:hypothetical protein